MSYHDPSGWRALPIIAPAGDRPKTERWRSRWTLLLLLVAAVALRFGQFGDPLAGLDEQFYLLVGDRMWHGELPYVDLWDRKPFGLFVWFAAIRLLPGDGVLAAQLVATACAAATAWQATLIARRRVGWVSATLAGVFYLAGLNMLWGETTQTPVFYNLLVVIAARLSMAADDRWRRGNQDVSKAVAALLLIGAAIQFKTNAAFEGAAFTLWLLARHRRVFRNRGGTVALAAALAIAAAAPTAAAMAFFAIDGHFAAWWQANVLSIMAKRGGNDAGAMAMLDETIVLTMPIVILTLIGLWRRTGGLRRWSASTLFIALWTGAALVDFIAIGGYYPHYAIPFLLASTPLVAQAFAIPRLGRWIAPLTLILPTAIAIAAKPRIGSIERRNAAMVVAALPRDVRTRCLFIYEGPVAFYGATQACRVSRFVFTAHLSSIREAPALGVDSAAALDAAMARRPGTVITLAHSTSSQRNPAMEARLGRWLTRDYRLLRSLPHRAYANGERVLVWRRSDLPDR